VLDIQRVLNMPEALTTEVLTLVREALTDTPVDPSVVAAGDAAFIEYIQKRRKHFRRYWLPFADAVYAFSEKAWEAASSPRNLDGTSDWTHPAVQAIFKELIGDRPWADYFTTRRDLLYYLRKIGQDRESFLAWFDQLDPYKQEMWGHPQTLWNKYKRPDRQAASADDAPDTVARLVAENEDLQRQLQEFVPGADAGMRHQLEQAQGRASIAERATADLEQRLRVAHENNDALVAQLGRAKWRIRWLQRMLVNLRQRSRR
jgi:hypothetical protein